MTFSGDFRGENLSGVSDVAFVEEFAILNFACSIALLRCCTHSLSEFTVT